MNVANDVTPPRPRFRRVFHHAVIPGSPGLSVAGNIHNPLGRFPGNRIRFVVGGVVFDANPRWKPWLLWWCCCRRRDEPIAMAGGCKWRMLSTCWYIFRGKRWVQVGKRWRSALVTLLRVIVIRSKAHAVHIIRHMVLGSVDKRVHSLLGLRDFFFKAVPCLFRSEVAHGIHLFCERAKLRFCGRGP